MSASDTWKGNWAHRIPERLAALGYSSLWAYASERPGELFIPLAHGLGDDVAAILLKRWLMLEAREAKLDARVVVRDLACRLVRQHLPLGWGVGDKVDYRRARVYSDLSILLSPEDDMTAAMHERIKALQPPMEWVPISPDDNILLEASMALPRPHFLPIKEARARGGLL